MELRVSDRNIILFDKTPIDLEPTEQPDPYEDVEGDEESGQLTPTGAYRDTVRLDEIDRAIDEIWRRSVGAPRHSDERPVRSPISPELRRMVLEAYGGCCVYCEDVARLAIDHVVPLSRGGTDEPMNMTIACHSCNSQKHATHLTEWLRSKTESERAGIRRRLSAGAAKLYKLIRERELRRES